MSLVIHFALFEVERNRYIRLFHNSIFYVAKLLDIELFTVMKIIAEQRIKPPDAGNITCISNEKRKKNGYLYGQNIGFFAW